MLHWHRKLISGKYPSSLTAADFRSASSMLTQQHDITLLVTEVIDARQREVSLSEIARLARSSGVEYVAIILYTSERVE